MPVELSSIYKQIADGNGKQYELLFSMVGLFSSVMEFDPVTDDPLPTTVDDVLYGIASFDMEKIGWQNDRLQHIVNYASGAIRNLIDVLHEKNLREYRIERPEKIREIDSKSMMWLAKKPGFTVKQKIASGQRMMGVFHTTSLDTAENRLFKSFMKQLDDLLLEKENACRKRGVAASDEFERFVSTVHSWLKSDEASLIEKWGNTPPNNTLLNDKNYRKIWKAHLMLQDINGQIENDMSRLSELTASCYFWLKVAKLNQSDIVRFKQRVLIPDYKNLWILKNKGSLECLYNKGEWKKAGISLDVNRQPENRDSIEGIANYVERACDIFLEGSQVLKPETKQEQEYALKYSVASVDLNSVKPTYHLDNGEKGFFTKKLIFQQLNGLSCSSARSKWISVQWDDVKTFTIHSIFDESLRSAIDDNDESKNAVAKACADFSKTIKDELCCRKCLYITNDDVDDFSPSVKAFKSSINSAFPKVEILPRSIAVLFSRLPDIQKRYQSGNKFSVHAIYDSYEIVTNIRIAFNKELAKQNPETKGLFFQRLGYYRLPRRQRLQKKIPSNMERVLTIPDAALLKNSFSVDDFHFESDAFFVREEGGNKDIVVYANEDTSLGGIVYERLQSISPDIPLWCDFLPKLSMKDSSGKEYVLVEPNRVSVRPVVGAPVFIPIPWNFIFPKGKRFYEFPLVQGDNKAASKYFAYISDSSFPLERDEMCRLNLTYTYGAPIPYNLEFISVSDKAAFRSVTVEWENKPHKDYIHIPGPKYPRIESWKEACSKTVVSKKGDEQSIAEKFVNAVDLTVCLAKNGWNKYQIVDYKPRVKKMGWTRQELPIEQAKFFILNHKIDGIDCSCSRGVFPAGYNVALGNSVCCSFESYVDPKGGVHWQAYDLYLCDENAEELKKTSYFYSAISVLQLWNQGRSTRDEDFPQKYYKYTKNLCDSAVSLLKSELIPKVTKNEIINMLAGLHQDAPSELCEFLNSILQNTLDSCREIKEDSDEIITLFHNKRLIVALGLAIGNAEMPWQKKLLEGVISFLSSKNLVLQRWGIEILGNALWRTEKCLSALSIGDVRNILPMVVDMIASFIKKDRAKIVEIWDSPNELKKDQDLSIKIWNKRRLFLKSIELVLALYRIREISQNEKMLKLVSSSPQNEIVSKLKSLLPDIEDFVKRDCLFLEKIKEMQKDNRRSVIYPSLKSRITFDIKDNKRDKVIPDYIYALDKFTRGEECSIVVRKIQDDDDERT